MSRGATLRVNQAAPKHHLFKPWHTSFLRKCKTEFDAFKLSMQYILKKPISSIMSLLAISLVLTFVLAAHVMISQIHTLQMQIKPTGEITAYLKVGLSKEDLETLQTHLQMIEEVGNIHYQSPEASLEKLKEKTDLGGIIDLLDANPLPGILTLYPKPGFEQIDSLQALKNALSEQPAIEEVSLDAEWIQKLNALVNLLSHAIWLIAAFVCLTLVIILSNTIRLSLEKHREEIFILSLIGATQSFIRRPFLYRTFCLCLLGAILATAFIYGSMMLIQPTVDKLAALYGTSYTIQPLSLYAVLGVIGISLILSWLSVRLAVYQYDEDL